MADRKGIRRSPNPMKAGDEGLALNPEDCVCCTPSMAGTVLGRLSRRGGIRAKGTRRTSRQSVRVPRPSVSAPKAAKSSEPTGRETIKTAALRVGLYAVTAKWKPTQTLPDAVFFDLSTGELVGHASAREMFEEARRLGAKRSEDGVLPRWTPPVQWVPTVRRGEPGAKFWRAVDSTWPYHFAAVQLEERGSASPGKTVRLDVLARAGFSIQDRDVLRGLGQEAELRAARGLSVGLSHVDAMTLGFVGVASSEGLTRAQAYAALRWAPGDQSAPAKLKTRGSVAKRDAPAKPKTPPRSKASRAKAQAPSASAEASESVAMDDGPAVRMDVVLRDLKDAASAKGQYVLRKHVAKAVRAMLNARQMGLSVTAPNYSFATTLDIQVKGSRFTADQNAALRALFGEDAGAQNEFTVLVTPFIGNSDSVPTGIVPSRIEAFRRRVAEAAGLAAPGPFATTAKRARPETKRPRVRTETSPPAKPKAAPLSDFAFPQKEPAGPRRKAPAATSTSPSTSGSVAMDGGAPVRMDVLLRDLRDAAKAKDQDVERKHVAKALRVMLQARRYGLSITTPNYSLATTIDIQPGKGRSSFSEAQNAVLRSAFGKDAGRRATFMVLVSGTVNDSNSVPTGIVPARIEEFRREVAKAAGLPPVQPYAEGAGSDAPKTPAASRAPSGFRVSDEKILALLQAFVRAVEGEAGVGSMVVQFALVQKVFLVRAERDGSTTTLFSVRPGAREVTVAFEHLALAERFIERFGQAIFGELRAQTEQTRVFDWLPEAVHEARWDVLMGSGSGASTGSMPEGVQMGAPLGVGRADHEGRRGSRVERLRSRADEARSEAKSRYDASGRDLPPWGEPIKIGHHSERRHRRALDRAHANMSKSVEATRKAVRLDARAEAAENNTAISSDDPRALERLKAKLAEMEAEREETKRKNRLARQGKLPDAENPLNPASIRNIAGKRKYPMPGYALKNLGAEIRRTRERIETLEKRQGRAARSLERGDVEVVENGELNRLQIFTGGKPPVENRTWLKRNGFRWARSEGAWQRQIGDAAWNAAMTYLDTFVEKRDDTPYARVESSPPKPLHTPADVAFWTEEFARLDEEFPGKDFDESTQDKVEEALRARKSGRPGEHALAYGQYRLGKMTVEEAVVLMYRYGRFARPKPRPKRPRKQVTSSMGLEAFVAAVKERGAEAGGQLFATKAYRGVHFNHYNVPKDTKDGVRRENNRMMLSIHGWEPGGDPPKDGKVKLTISVARGMKDVRGRTTTPEAMVDVVVEMFRRHSALKSV